MTNKEILISKTLYHGRQSNKPIDAFINKEVYLFENKERAIGYGNRYIYGRKNEIGKVLTITNKEGKVKNVDDLVKDKIIKGLCINDIIAKKANEARNNGYRYLTYIHTGDIVYVSLFPNEDLKIEKEELSESFIRPLAEKKYWETSGFVKCEHCGK